MRNLLITLSAIVTIGGAVPYILAIIRGTTKPRVVSWFTWTLLTGIAAAASLSDHQYAAGILSLSATFEVGLIVILGLKHGDRKFDKTDIICQAAALVGLALWLVFNSPGIAVLASMVIDFIGCIPTIKHSWQKPHEETWFTFALSSLGGGLALLAVRSWALTAIGYPLYIFVINIFMMLFIVLSPNRKLKGEPAELREL